MMLGVRTSTANKMFIFWIEEHVQYDTIRPTYFRKGSLVYFVLARKGFPLGHDSAWLSRKPFLHVYKLPCRTFSAAGSSRLAQLVERETVNLEVVGSIPILRVQLTFFIY